VPLKAVNRSNPQPGHKAVVFGAGPIGLGAAIGYKSLGVEHVVVDIIPARLQRALTVGADAIINSAEEDVKARLFELHGAATDGIGQPRPGTDIYLDAAGVPAVIDTVIACAKHRATLCIPAVHKKPVLIDLGQILTTELDLKMSMGYPSEIFEVTNDIVANRDKYGAIISHHFDFTDALEALKLATTPGAADKVVITFG
jgi:threonine dehydrogenase-like Zn-dependent dehydrogenase